MRKEVPNQTDDLKRKENEQTVPFAEKENGCAAQELEEGEDKQAKIDDYDSAQELAEVKARLVRIHADFDNYRKRINKEKEEWFQYACLELVKKLLPVLDNLDRAMLSLDEQNEEIKNVFSGIRMIEKQFKEILQKEGLKPIEAVGASFDTLFHEAVMQVPATEGVADNQIVEEVRKGYLFKDKVIRASMVKVAQSE